MGVTIKMEDAIKMQNVIKMEGITNMDDMIKMERTQDRVYLRVLSAVQNL
jgi:hypothetical protein